MFVRNRRRDTRVLMAQGSALRASTWPPIAIARSQGAAYDLTNSACLQQPIPFDEYATNPTGSNPGRSTTCLQGSFQNISAFTRRPKTVPTAGSRISRTASERSSTPGCFPNPRSGRRLGATTVVPLAASNGTTLATRGGPTARSARNATSNRTRRSRSRSACRFPAVLSSREGNS
jgi:hypothetical protein